MRTFSPSNLAFGPALRRLMAWREVSTRSLAELTAAGGDGLRHSYIAYLARGEKQPTVANMELLAHALDVDPRYFREYREHEASVAARRAARKHGADAVLQALAALDDAPVSVR